MSTANTKASKEATGLVMKFSSPNKSKANGPNNYLTWADAIYTSKGSRYGPMVRVFADLVPYVVPDLESVDVPQADDPGMEGLSAINLNPI